MDNTNTGNTNTDNTLHEGEYKISPDCTGFIKHGILTVRKRKIVDKEWGKGVRCKDCIHRVRERGAWYFNDTSGWVCEMRPRTDIIGREAFYHVGKYHKTCEKFEQKPK